MLKADVQEQRRSADGRVVRVGGAVPTCAEIGFSGKGRVPPRSGAKRHPLLVVLAERAKNIRECCMKERAGNCEHILLSNDWSLCAVPQQTGLGRAGSLDGSLSLLRWTLVRWKQSFLVCWCETMLYQRRMHRAEA